MKLRLILILISLSLGMAFPGSTNAFGRSLPFSVGEKLIFKVRWTFIPAGEFVLEVLPIETVNGIRSYHFSLTARTYPFIDLFYKVRDQIDAFADSEMTRSILYKKKQGGKSKRDVIVSFNWEKLEAQYADFGKKREPISLLPGSFDPLSVFYAFRLHHLKENMEILKPVSDGKKCVVGKARVIKRERIEVVSGSYDTFLVEPDLKHIGGVFRKSKDAKLQIWVTADSRRIPVQIKSKVIVGSFVAELISVENTVSGSQNLRESPSVQWASRSPHKGPLTVDSIKPPNYSHFPLLFP